MVVAVKSFRESDNIILLYGVPRSYYCLHRERIEYVFLHAHRCHLFADARKAVDLLATFVARFSDISD